MKTWKVLAKHKWLTGCLITESINVQDDSKRKFTATIRGWRNFVIYEGDSSKIDTSLIVNKVKEIRELIDNGDKEVFQIDHKISC